MAEVVDDPGGEELAQGHATERGMGAGAGQAGRVETDAGDLAQALAARGREALEQDGRGLALGSGAEREPLANRASIGDGEIPGAPR